MTMIRNILKFSALALLTTALIFPLWLSNDVSAESVPEWIKNTAKWFGDDLISESEFLNAIKFLIENDILVLESEKASPISEEKNTIDYVTIPNGNSLQGNTGYYVPINLVIEPSTTVVWQNEDSNAHTVQSQDDDGKPSGIFNSNVLQTSDTFEHKFSDTGEYHYYCTIHPWRVGVVTVR